MYRGLIDYLSFAYTMLCKGRRVLCDDDIRDITKGAHAVVRNAEEAIDPENRADKEDRADLEQARKIDEHIEEMTVFLMSMEIV